ncbi:MAG TPA: flagellar motor protein MotB, partial [Rhodospirillales bacterium]
MSAYRRRKDDSGAPRWMVTFADLMSLLFALFVLLLSFAKVDNETFQRNAGPMRDAFGLGDRIMITAPRGIPIPGEPGPGDRASRSAGSQIMAETRRLQAKRNFLFNFRRIMETELAHSI